MARNIGADGRDVFRAVITSTRGDRSSTWYEGPYNKAGTARARISFWRKHLGRSGVEVTGHVEKADTVWRRLDDDGNPAPAPRRVLTNDEYEAAYLAAARSRRPIDGTLEAAFATVGVLTPPPPPEDDACTSLYADDDGTWWQCEEQPGHDGTHDCGDCAWTDDAPDAIPPRPDNDG